MLRQNEDIQKIDPSKNKYVYKAIVPVGWVARNGEEVKYREIQTKQDIKGTLKKTALAFSAGALANIARLNQHQSSTLATSAINLDYAAQLQLNKLKPGVGRTGNAAESAKYEFSSTLPPENIVRFVTASTDEKTADEYMNGVEGLFLKHFNDGLEKTSTKIQDEYFDDQREGNEMRFHEVYITTSQPPEYVEIHGIDNGLIFYSKEEAIQCSETDNFSIPVMQKPLSLAQTFGFVDKDDEDPDHVLVDISSLKRGKETLDKLQEKLIQTNNTTEMMGEIEKELPQLKEDILMYLKTELDKLTKLKNSNDQKTRLKADVATQLIKELNKLDVDNNNNNDQKLQQMMELMEKVQSFAYYKTKIFSDTDSIEKWDNIKKKFSLEVRTYSDNLESVYGALKSKSEGRSLNSSTFKMLDQLTGFDQIATKMEKEPSHKSQKQEIEPEKKVERKMSDRTQSIINEINTLQDKLSKKINQKAKTNFKASYKTKFLFALADAIKNDFVNFEKNQSEFIENFVDRYKKQNPIEYAEVISGLTSRVNGLIKVLKSDQKPIVNTKTGEVTPEIQQDTNKIQQDTNTFSFRPFRKS